MLELTPAATAFLPRQFAVIGSGGMTVTEAVNTSRRARNKNGSSGKAASASSTVTFLSNAPYSSSRALNLTSNASAPRGKPARFKIDAVKGGTPPTADNRNKRCESDAVIAPL